MVKILEREPDWSALPAATPAACSTAAAPLSRQGSEAAPAGHRRRQNRDRSDRRGAAGRLSSSRCLPVPAKIRRTWLPWVARRRARCSCRRVGGPAPCDRRRRIRSPMPSSRVSRIGKARKTGAEISPDGKFVAFVADREGEFDIWLSQVGTGRFQEPHTRTFDPLTATGIILRKLWLFWRRSGDLVQLVGRPGAEPKMLMALMGGAPRAFLGEGNNAPAWSPDGTRLVVFQQPATVIRFLSPIAPAQTPDRILAPDAEGSARTTIRSGHQTANGSTSCTGSEPRTEMTWMCGAFDPQAGSPEQLTKQHAAVNFLAPLDARTLLYVSRAEDRSGPWLWALDVERKVDTPGNLGPRAIHVGVSQSRRPARGRHGRQPHRQLVARAAARSASPMIRTLNPTRCRPTRALGAALRRARRCSICPAAERAMGSGGFRTERRPKCRRAPTRRYPSRPRYRPTGAAWPSSSDRRGNGTWRSCRRTARTARTLAAGHRNTGRGGPGRRRTGRRTATWIVTGGRDAQGPGVVQDPRGRRCVPSALVDGQAVNPVWSPDGKLIVYSGGFFNGQVELLGVRPDGTSVELPHVRVASGRLSLLARRNRPGAICRSFDLWISGCSISPRETSVSSPASAIRAGFRHSTSRLTGNTSSSTASRENSDIVLIDLPK